MGKFTSPGKGVRYSLGGFPSRPDTGLVMERQDAATTFNPGVELLHQNPFRVWAIIQNLDGNNVLVAFESGTGIAANMIIPPGGNLQIDDNLPWTGPVFLASVTGNVTYIEASIEPG
jgi:hypothetical protein